MLIKTKEKMKVNAVDYNLYTNKNIGGDDSSKLRVCLISDFHDMPTKRMLQIARYIVDQKPDMIVIAGDILHSSKYRIGSNSQENLKEFLRIISQLCPVYVGLGNHDLLCMNDEYMKGYFDLASAGINVHPLSNNVFYDNKLNVRVGELHFEHEVYAPSQFDSGRAAIKLAKSFLEMSELQPTDEFKGSINILNCHDGKLLAQVRSIETLEALKIPSRDIDYAVQFSEKIKNFDFVCSGHLHGGYAAIAPVIRMINNNPEKFMDNGVWEMPKEINYKGILTMLRPWVFKRTNMCRGTAYVGEDLRKIVQLPNGKYYEVEDNFYHKASDYTEIEKKDALQDIFKNHRIPITTSGGLNPLFSLKVGIPEVTMLTIVNPTLFDVDSLSFQTEFYGNNVFEKKR